MVVTLVAAVFFCLFVFFDLPGPTFFLFLNIHKVHVLANLRKLFGLKQKKKKKALQFYILLRIQCIHVWLYIPVHRII